ncbi:MAG: cytochrome c [Saprospiraceae bacterium]
MRNSIFLFLIVISLSCTVSTSSYKEGKFIYTKYCSSCHGLNAEGLGKWYPSLTDTSYIKINRSKLASWIRFGISRDSNAINKSRFNLVDMPENKYLQDADLCNILNYLNEQYWHQAAFNIEELNFKK